MTQAQATPAQTTSSSWGSGQFAGYGSTLIRILRTSFSAGSSENLIVNEDDEADDDITGAGLLTKEVDEEAVGTELMDELAFLWSFQYNLRYIHLDT